MKTIDISIKEGLARAKIGDLVSLFDPAGIGLVVDAKEDGFPSRTIITRREKKIIRTTYIAGINRVKLGRDPFKAYNKDDEDFDKYNAMLQGVGL